MWPRWTMTPVGRDVADADRVVLRGLGGLGQVETDLLGVDVEGGDELHVGDVVVTELDVHQAGHGARRVGVLVVLDALDQGRRAVADAHDCYSYRTHEGLFLPSGCFRWLRRPRGPRWMGVSLVVLVSLVVSGAGRTGWSARRSALIRSPSHLTSRSTDSIEWRRSSER